MSATDITTEPCAARGSTRWLRPRRLALTASGVAARDVLVAFFCSRVLVYIGSLVGAWGLPHAGYKYMLHSETIHRVFFGGWPLSNAFNYLLSPLIRGDALTYLVMPQYGYHVPGTPSVAVYFPGYPALIAALGGFSSPGAAVIAGYAVSLVACLGALWMLHRLVARDFGPPVARTTVMLVAFFPWSYFFSAPYTESLFLLLSVSSLYAGRSERWAIAGLCAAGASATRNSGVLLLVPLLILYVYGPARIGRFATVSPREALESLRGRLGRSAGWLALAPVGLVAFSVYLQSAFGDALAWSSQQAAWGRAKAMPWDGVYFGVRAVWHVVDGSVVDPLFRVPAILDALTLALVGVCLVIAWRRLPAAYAAYASAIVVVTLSAVSHTLVSEPLISFPRYVLVVFPLFIALALVCERRRLTRFVVPASAAGLVVLSTLFAAGYPYF